MVVVVVDADLEKAGASGGLDTAHKTRVDEVAEHVVDGLQARAIRVALHSREDLVSARVRHPLKSIEHRATRRRCAETRGTDDPISTGVGIGF